MNIHKLAAHNKHQAPEYNKIDVTATKEEKNIIDYRSLLSLKLNCLGETQSLNADCLSQFILYFN